jgi:hypothetical protein
VSGELPATFSDENRSLEVQTVVVNLLIPADEYQRLYQGAVRDVVARSVDGRRIRFPAAILRPYVTHTGIHGRFRIVFDEHNRFQTIERMD